MFARFHATPSILRKVITTNRGGTIPVGMHSDGGLQARDDQQNYGDVTDDQDLPPSSFIVDAIRCQETEEEDRMDLSVTDFGCDPIIDGNELGNLSVSTAAPVEQEHHDHDDTEIDDVDDYSPFSSWTEAAVAVFADKWQISAACLSDLRCLVQHDKFEANRLPASKKSLKVVKNFYFFP
jgi:hypothetical protein